MQYNSLEDDVSPSFHEVGEKEGEKQDQNTYKPSFFFTLYSKLKVVRN